jgi:hypothetical protein
MNFIAHPVDSHSDILRVNFFTWLVQLYANPGTAQRYFATLSTTERWKAALTRLAQVTVAVFLAVMACRILIIHVLHQPELEVIQPGFRSAVTFQLREASIGCAIALASFLILFYVLTVTNSRDAVSAAVVGGAVSGITGITAHVIAGEARGLLVLYGIALIAGCTLLGTKVGKDFREPRLKLFLGGIFCFFGASVFLVSTRAAKSAPIGLTGGYRGALVVGAAFGSALGFIILAGYSRQITLKTALLFGSVCGVAAYITGTLVWNITQGAAFGLILAFSLLICILRAYYLPFHFAFLWPRAQGTYYRYHPAKWDFLCSVPFTGLDRLLVDYARKHPAEAEAEIERLRLTLSQHQAAVRAKVRILVAEATECTNLKELKRIALALPNDYSDLQAMKMFVNSVAMNQFEIDQTFRSTDKYAAAEKLYRELKEFTVSGVPQFIRNELIAAIDKWSVLAQKQVESLKREDPIPEGYNYGGAVDHKINPFVFRKEITDDLVRQVQNPHGCSGILLYGRRRLGKSTVIKNLEGFIPKDVRCINITMLDARATASLGSLLSWIMSEIGTVVEGVTRPSQDLSLREFQSAIATVNQLLSGRGERLIISVDEFEILNDKFLEGQFSPDILGVIREGSRSFREVVWMFVGSNLMSELSHPAWNQNLLELHTTRVTPFDLSETRKLLCEPFASRVPGAQGGWLKVEPDRWGGEAGIERIHSESGGWPSIIQLIAGVVAHLLKKEGQDRANLPILERALQKAVVEGHNLFEEVIYRGSKLDGEWEYLREFARQEEVAPLPKHAVIDSLWRRELIERGTHGFRLKVPIIGRWLREWYPL